MPGRDDAPGQVKKHLDEVVMVQSFLTAFAALTGDGRLWYWDPVGGLYPFSYEPQPVMFRSFAVNDRANIVGIGDDGSAWLWAAVDPATGVRGWTRANTEKH